jgi:hypothetical protein
VNYPAHEGQKFHGNDLQTMQTAGVHVTIVDRSYTEEDVAKARDFAQNKSRNSSTLSPLAEKSQAFGAPELAIPLLCRILLATGAGPLASALFRMSVPFCAEFDGARPRHSRNCSPREWRREEEEEMRGESGSQPEWRKSKKLYHGSFLGFPLISNHFCTKVTGSPQMTAEKLCTFAFTYLVSRTGSDDKKAPHRTGCEATGGRGSVESDLLNRTTNRGEDVIRIGTDEADRANYEH